MEYRIRPISVFDIQKIVDFADQWIAENYYKKSQLRALLMKGVREDVNASFVALDKNKIIGFGLAFAPSEWITQDDEFNLSSHLWNVPSDDVAYLKNLVVDKNYQGLGIGRAILDKTTQAVKDMGAKAIVCHSWVESPKNTSRKYFDKMNFKPVNLHDNFWYFKDYICAKYSPRKCDCSACEMIKVL
jgi:ribosomal protein S18 acetylase RimI-like enzyme